MPIHWAYAPEFFQVTPVALPAAQKTPPLKAATPAKHSHKASTHPSLNWFLRRIEGEIFKPDHSAVAKLKPFLDSLKKELPKAICKLERVRTPGDDLQLNAVSVKHKEHNPNRQTSIIFLGQKGMIGHYLDLVKDRFQKQGDDVIIITYRGYSGNPGKPSYHRVINDCNKALRKFVKDPAKTRFIGISLGCDILLKTLAKRSEQQGLHNPAEKFTEIELRAPMSGLTNSIEHNAKTDRKYLALKLALPFYRTKVREYFGNTIDVLSKVSANLFKVACSQSDEKIPHQHTLDFARCLLENIGEGKLDFCEPNPGFSHDDVCTATSSQAFFRSAPSHRMSVRFG